MYMAWFLFCLLMHVLVYILDMISSLYRFNNCPLCGKAYAVMLYVAGLSLRDLKESVRRWFHRFSKIFSVGLGRLWHWMKL